MKGVTIAFGITVVIVVFASFVKLGELFGKEYYLLKFFNKTKHISSFVAKIGLAIISLLGGFMDSTEDNVGFLLIYVSIYALAKELYVYFAIQRLDDAVLYDLQKHMERAIAFSDIFELKEEFNIKFGYQRHWININDADNSISFTYDNVEYVYSLTQNICKKNLEYIRKQLECSASKLRNKNDIEQFNVYIVDDESLIEECFGKFIVHEDTKNIHVPMLANESIFNFVMIYGLIAAICGRHLCNSWDTISVCEKVLGIMGGCICTILFVVGVIVVFITCCRKDFFHARPANCQDKDKH